MKKYRVTITDCNGSKTITEQSISKQYLETKYRSLYRFSYPKTSVLVELDVLDVNNQLKIVI
jgi:hypothetical protein